MDNVLANYPNHGAVRAGANHHQRHRVAIGIGGIGQQIGSPGSRKKVPQFLV